MHEFQAYENKLLRASYAYLFRKVTSQLVKKRLKTVKIHQSAQ